MRRLIKGLLFTGCSLMLLVGCNKQSQVEEIIPEENVMQSASEETDKIEDEIDIDLTQMSSEIVLALLYQFVVAPEEYSGQSIRMQGNYYSNYNEQTGVNEYYCVVKDAAACCAQGMEFIWKDMEQGTLEKELLDGQEVIITGILETYKLEDDSRVYCRIKDAVLEKVV